METQNITLQMKHIYMATADAHEDEKDQRPHHFASIDNERWTEIGEPWPLTIDHYDELAEHVGIKTDADGRSYFPILLATSYLRCWMKNLKFLDPIQVGDSRPVEALAAESEG